MIIKMEELEMQELHDKELTESDEVMEGVDNNNCDTTTKNTGTTQGYPKQADEDSGGNVRAPAGQVDPLLFPRIAAKEPCYTWIPMARALGVLAMKRAAVAAINGVSIALCVVYRSS